MNFLVQQQAELDLNIGETGSDKEELVTQCRKVVNYSVKTGHPRFFNLLISGLDPAGLGASWITEALNCNA
jgi:sulfinoalanine decarboxylase